VACCLLVVLAESPANDKVLTPASMPRFKRVFHKTEASAVGPATCLTAFKDMMASENSWHRSAGAQLANNAAMMPGANGPLDTMMKFWWENFAGGPAQLYSICSSVPTLAWPLFVGQAKPAGAFLPTVFKCGAAAPAKKLKAMADLWGTIDAVNSAAGIHFYLSPVVHEFFVEKFLAADGITYQYRVYQAYQNIYRVQDWLSDDVADVDAGFALVKRGNDVFQTIATDVIARITAKEETLDSFKTVIQTKYDDISNIQNIAATNTFKTAWNAYGKGQALTSAQFQGFVNALAGTCAAESSLDATTGVPHPAGAKADFQVAMYIHADAAGFDCAAQNRKDVAIAAAQSYIAAKQISDNFLDGDGVLKPAF